MIPKFRAWYQKGTLPMLKVNLISFDQQFIDAYIDDEAVAETEMSLDLSEVILMQSTGLFDKNGVEIFEGDVVRFTVVNQAMCGIYEVRQAKSGAWRMDNAIQGRELWLAKPHSLEVLGNVHQHPHLLEVADGH